MASKVNVKRVGESLKTENFNFKSQGLIYTSIHWHNSTSHVNFKLKLKFKLTLNWL